MAKVFTIVRLTYDYNPYNGHVNTIKVVGTYTDINMARTQLNKDFDDVLKDWDITRDDFEPEDDNSTRLVCDNCYIYPNDKFYLETDDACVTITEKIYSNELQ